MNFRTREDNREPGRWSAKAKKYIAKTPESAADTVRLARADAKRTRKAMRMSRTGR